MLRRHTLLVLLAVALAGCLASDATAPPALAPLDVTENFFVVPDTSLLVAGMGRQLGVETSSYSYASGSATWTSSNPTVATVDRNGYVTAVREGRTTITVATNDRSASAPVRVQRYGTPLRFIQISTNFGSSCGVTTAGEIYCWGDGSNGSLGTTQSVDACEALSSSSRGTFRGTYRCSAVPVRVESNAVFTAVATTYRSSCALDRSGARYCWGMVDTVRRMVPQRTTDTLHFASISSRCGITLSGDAYCWGPSTSGALGTGDSTSNYAPVDSPARVSGGLKWKSLDSDDIAACGIALDGVAYCWGDDWHQQLGIGPTESDSGCFLYTCKHAPTAVSSSARFTQISVGSYAVCALTVEGDAYCWGFIGGTYLSVPTSLGALRFASLTVGDLSFCGITQDHKLLCSKYAGPGPVSLIPGTPALVEASPPSPLRRLAKPSLFNGCGIGTDDLVYCWGDARAVLGLGILAPVGFNARYSLQDPMAGAVVGQR